MTHMRQVLPVVSVAKQPILRIKPISLAIAACFFHAASSYAADKVVAGGKEQTLPTVNVSGAREVYQPGTPSVAKVDAPLRDIPQTINVVPAQVIKDQAARSMTDVLKTVPGVGLSNGDGQRDQVTIRGFTAIADQFLDGVRDDALYFRDLSNIEQIEVVKGPASVLYGRGSSGGLINRVTKKPHFTADNEVGVTVGSYSLKRIEVDANQPFADNTMALRVTGAMERSGSFRDQGFLERESVAPSLLWRLTPATTVLMQIEHNRDFRVTDFGIPSFQGKPLDVPVGAYYGSSDARADDYTRATTNYATLTVDHEIAPTLVFHNVLRYYDHLLDRNNTTAQSVNLNVAVPTVTMRRGSVYRDEKGWFNQSELKHKLTAAGMEHQLLYGIELGEQTKDQISRTQNSLFTTPLFAPVLQRPPFVAATLSADGESTFTTTSVYVQDLVALAPQWKMLAGLRYDRYQQEYANRLPGGAPLDRTDNFLSPRLCLVWQPDAVQSYYISATRSFQPSGESFALAANNSQLAPEKTTNFEVGAKYDWLGGKLVGGVSVFHVTRTDIKVTDPTNPALLILAGEQRTDGAELTLAGDVGNGWNIYGGYAFLDAEITKSTSTIGFPYVTAPTTAAVPLQGKVPSLTPRNSANLWVNKQLGGGFSAAGGVNARSSMYASASNVVALPSATTIDLALFYRVKPWDVALNLKNVTDKRYYASAHGGNDNLNTPGAPRTVEVSMRYKF
jgi:catecholate siderophore receptor